MQRTTVLAPLDTMAAIDPSAVASAAFATATRAFTFSDLPELDQTPTARRWATHRFLPFEAAHDASALALSEHGGPHRENLSDLSEPLSPETLRMGSIGGEGAQHNGARSSMWRDTATSGGGGSIAPAQMGSGGAVLQSNIDALLSLGLPQLGHLRETGIVLSRKSAWLVHARDQAVDDVGRWTLLLLSMLAVSVISLVVNLPAVVNVAGPLAIEAQLASRTLVYAQSIFLFFTFGIHPTITGAFLLCCITRASVCACSTSHLPPHGSTHTSSFSLSIFRCSEALRARLPWLPRVRSFFCCGWRHRLRRRQATADKAHFADTHRRALALDEARRPRTPARRARLGALVTERNPNAGRFACCVVECLQRSRTAAACRSERCRRARRAHEPLAALIRAWPALALAPSAVR